MRVTQKVKKILDWYEGDPPGVKANLARILSTGKLGGTGKVVILPVDQGFEHGPARSFAPNPPAYDPHYHYQLAIEAGLNAYAAPLGMIAAGRRHVRRADPDHPEMQQLQQPGDQQGPGGHRRREGRAAPRLRRDRLHHLSRQRIRLRPDGGTARTDRRGEGRRPRRGGVELSARPEPRSRRPRPRSISAPMPTQMAALMGANIIKVKPPTAVISLEAAKKSYEKIDGSTLAKRVEHVMQCAFNGKRIVVFSGGEAKDLDGVL